jgi:ketosteroid isomerase-like protein
MYKWTVRALVRHSIDRLNEGDPSFLLRLATPDAELAFPGDNSWSSMFRPVVKSRERHASHRGKAECRAFANRFAAEGLRLVVEDILVNGPPWRMRVAIRALDYQVAADGTDGYNNRAVAFLELRWGRLVRWEDYEDTERISAWDERRKLQSVLASGDAVDRWSSRSV